MPQFITEDDKRRLRQLASHGKNDPVDSAPDITETSPQRDGASLNPMDSASLVLYAVEHTNSEAANRFGVSERTVERHKAFWANGEDAEKVSLQKTSTVDDRLCAAMRCAAEEGASLGELAERHELAKSTVQHHVSASSSQPCCHSIEVKVPRVEFSSGGLNGNPKRQRDKNGRFTTYA